MPLVIIITVLILALTSLTNGHKSASIDPELMADCIAEHAYTNPQKDRFQELISAIVVCQYIEGGE